MKFTLSWLKDYLDTDASLNEITDKLTALGLEVEGVEDASSAPDIGERARPTRCSRWRPRRGTDYSVVPS